MALPAHLSPLPSSNRATPIHFPLCPPPTRFAAPSAASARPTQRWRKRLRAFEFQGSRQIRAQRRREPREPRGRSMDSLPGEDPTLPLAFEGRYGAAAGRGCAQAARVRVRGRARRPRTGSGERAPGVVPSALSSSSFPSVCGLQLPDISRGDPRPGPPSGQGKAASPHIHPCPGASRWSANLRDKPQT